jgi:hypothetical protein
MLELECLARSINEDTTPLVTIDDGYNALDVAHQILDKMSMTKNAL